MSAAATLKNVAANAGVSISVASRALSGQAKAYRISAATEKRVKAVADELGFRPSQTARSLRLKKSGLLGVVVPDLSNPFFASISRQVALATECHGYSVIVADSREDTAHEIRLLKQLEDRQVEALLVCPVGTEFAHLQTIRQRPIPLVIADRTFPKSDVVQVTSNHQAGAVQATQLLCDHGHQIIGVLQGLPGTLPNEERLRGHALALEANHIPNDPALVAGDNFTESSGYDSAYQLLSSRPDITALFAFSTPNAMGAMRAAIQLGRHVPEDLSIIAFDDSPFADLMAVPLTTVCQDVNGIGKLAAELILQSLNPNELALPPQHVVDVRVIHRDSVCKVPTQ